MKLCTKCGVEKDESEFYLNHGHANCWCKECRKAETKRYNRAKGLKSKAERAAEHLIKWEKIRAIGFLKCKKCRTKKPLSEFNKRKNLSGVAWFSVCKVCEHERQIVNRANRPEVYKNTSLMRNYGITFEYYESRLAQQKGRCPLCGVTYDQSRRSTQADVDHDHVTGMFRDIICHVCNWKLSIVDDAELLAKLIAYRDYHRKRTLLL